MLIVSFIRHGESFDNLKPIWAGHKDAELTELGVQQAKALGNAYANTCLEAIITSDLKRAHATALALLDGQPDPKPSFTAACDLREQYVGDAEGQPWLMHQIPNKSLEDHFKDRQYPLLFDRNERFPNGECLNDVAARAERVTKDLVLEPYFSRAILAGAKVEDIHVAVVSHGICISELIRALLKRDSSSAPAENYRGLMNTGWTRVTVQAKASAGAPLSTREPGDLPLTVTVTDVNRHEHISAGMKRQAGVPKHDKPKKISIWEILSARGKESQA